MLFAGTHSDVNMLTSLDLCQRYENNFFFFQLFSHLLKGFLHLFMPNGLVTILGEVFFFFIFPEAFTCRAMMVKHTNTHTHVHTTVWRTQNKSVCRRCQPQEITLLSPSGKPLFTVSSTEKTDKIRIPSAYPLRRRQCNCGKFYLVSKLAASTTASIRRYSTDILYSAVATAQNKCKAVDGIPPAFPNHTRTF